MRTAAAWLVSLTAAGAGVLAAHAVAYGALAPVPHGGSHGYLPFVEAVVCAALALGVALAAWTARGGTLARPSPALYAVAGPLAFLLQETAERGFALPLDPVVLLGLALQFPFALVAYTAARLLLGVAETIGRQDPYRPRPRAVPLLRAAAARDDHPLRTPLLARAGRAPPPLSA